MRRRRELTTVGLFVGLVLVLLGLVIGFDNKPLLGLDLQGGLSATLQPQDSNVPSSSVEQAKEIIRNRIDALGVAEPDIVRQGKTVVVQLPGVKDPDKAKAVIGRTAKMEFRPLLAQEWTAANPLRKTTSAKSSSSSSSTTSSSTTSTTSTTTTTTAPKPVAPEVKQAKQYGNPDVPTVVEACLSKRPSSVPAKLGKGQVLLPGKIDLRAKTVTCYWMGPVGLKGEALSGADPQLNASEWEVNVRVKGSKQGQADKLMNACYNNETSCPTTGSGQSGARGRMAIVLDGQVLSAPTVDQANLADEPNGFVIQGQFTHSEASELALELRYGALPVTFKQATFQKVSATLGKDSLHAGLVAGAVGLALVAIYIIAFYRVLGLVAIGSLASATGLLWVFIAYMGSHHGLALTLSGITGIIVSIGVAVDSNVVCYEHLREDLDKGRSLKSTVDRSFKDAWRVIISADLVSLIGAALLYYFTVGSVRGFALYLLVATVLDLLASWFFMRPLVLLIGRSQWFQERPGWLGLHRRKTPRPAPSAGPSAPGEAKPAGAET